MGLFDLFDSSEKIYRQDFKKALRKISVLSFAERSYVEKAFSDELSDGLSKVELQKRCQQLMHQPGDLLEPEEVEKIKKKLLKNID